MTAADPIPTTHSTLFPECLIGSAASQLPPDGRAPSPMAPASFSSYEPSAQLSSQFHAFLLKALTAGRNNAKPLIKNTSPKPTPSGMGCARRLGNPFIFNIRSVNA